MLFRSLAGVEKQFQGRIHLEEGVRIGYLQQEPELDGETVIACLEPAVEETKKMIRDYEEISNKMAEPDADIDALMEEWEPEFEELLKNVAPGGEESGNQTLSLSAWGCFCPVALTDHGAKALGLAVSRSHEANRALMLDCSMTGEDGVAKPKFVAEYCGKVFMLSSPLALQIFCANPLPYVSNKPGWTTGSFRSGSWDPEAQAPLPRLRVLVVGPPCAGKTEVAKAIADRYGALHVDALKALELTLLDSSPLALEVSSAMGEGRGLTPGLMTRLLASQLNLPEPEMPEPPPPVEPPVKDCSKTAETATCAVEMRPYIHTTPT